MLKRENSRIICDEGKIARERFELSSRAPEAPMLDHYTTGLQTQSILQIIYFNVAMLSRRFLLLVLRGRSSILG